MALVLADRVKETTTTIGTGSVTLLGASTGYQSFAVIGNGNTTFYAIAGQTSNEWEVGIGTYTSSGTTLARTTVLSNSSGTQPSALSFSVGTKDVFVTYPASKSVNLDANGNLIVPISALTSSNTSTLQVGSTTNFSDTGIISNFVGSTNSYLQSVLQNTSAGTSASAEYIVYNNNGSASTNFATFGINSSTYAGSGSINAPSYGYFLSGSTDIVVGTIGANNIHLVTNSQTTDAVTVNTSNAVAFNGSYGTSGQVLTSAGSGAAPTWSAVTLPPVSLNDITISTSYTFPANKNAISVGPVTVASGVTVTVGSGQRWLVV